MSSDPYAWIEKSLATIHRADWYRSVQTIYGRPGATILLEGREIVNFASNDYLGLAGDERLIQAAVSAVKEFGTGSTGSRLLTGHRELHRELELAIASLKQTEDAVVFSSGYLANLGAIASLVGKRDLILSDQYNHSSLKNGAILSGAAVVEYNHCDVEDLRAKLQECVGVASPRHRYRRCLILTDSVFSMDGDLCPLPQLLAIAEEFSCMLLVDEAHATGVFGENGAGCVEHFGCTGKPLIQVGTLSKALGSLGGYVAGSSSLIDFIRNRAPSWIYTTGLTPADTAAALKAVNIVRKEPQLRHQLWQNVETFKTLLDEQIPNWKGTDKNYPDRNCHRNLESQGNSQLPITNYQLPITNYQLPITNSYSPIFCFLLKDAAQALAVGKQLKEQGIFAPAIRPPTVNYSRIRVSLMATHELVHIEKLVEALGAMPAAGYAYAFLKKT